LKCDKCGLEFLNPIPDSKKIMKYYPKEDYYSFKRNNLAVLYNKISAYYYSGKNKLFNFFVSPIKSFLYKYYTDNDSKKKIILEIGCGDGSSLELYKKYDLDTKGLEPYGSELTKREMNLGISRESVENAGYLEEQFDYILLREVLEHISKQEIVLKKCFRWLKNGGKLLIVVPNTKSLWKEVFKQNWYGYDAPRHIYNYDPANLSFLLKKIGFKIEKIRTYDLPYMFYGSLDFYFLDKTKIKKKPFSFIFFKIICFPISLIITCLNKGSLIEIECSK